jgi:two-component system, OmpR family, response regulator
MNFQTVLLIDDDQSILKVAEITLSKIGMWNVVTARSGQAGLDLLETIAPDLVLLDVMMPGMDGRTTFKLLKERPENAFLPVIFMTAKVLRHEVQDYLQSGAAGVISKPFDPMCLSQEIKMICTQWQSRIAA